MHLLPKTSVVESFQSKPNLVYHNWQNLTVNATSSVHSNTEDAAIASSVSANIQNVVVSNQLIQSNRSNSTSNIVISTQAQKFAVSNVIESQVDETNISFSVEPSPPLSPAKMSEFNTTLDDFDYDKYFNKQTFPKPNQTSNTSIQNYSKNSDSIQCSSTGAVIRQNTQNSNQNLNRFLTSSQLSNQNFTMQDQAPLIPPIGKPISEYNRKIVAKSSLVVSTVLSNPTVSHISAPYSTEPVAPEISYIPKASFPSTEFCFETPTKLNESTVKQCLSTDVYQTVTESQKHIHSNSSDLASISLLTPSHAVDLDPPFPCIPTPNTSLQDSCTIPITPTKTEQKNTFNNYKPIGRIGKIAAGFSFIKNSNASFLPAIDEVVSLCSLSPQQSPLKGLGSKNLLNQNSFSGLTNRSLQGFSNHNKTQSNKANIKLSDNNVSDLKGFKKSAISNWIDTSSIKLVDNLQKKFIAEGVKVEANLGSENEDSRDGLELSNSISGMELGDYEETSVKNNLKNQKPTHKSEDNDSIDPFSNCEQITSLETIKDKPLTDEEISQVLAHFDVKCSETSQTVSEHYYFGNNDDKSDSRKSRIDYDLSFETHQARTEYDAEIFEGSFEHESIFNTQAVEYASRMVEKYLGSDLEFDSSSSIKSSSRLITNPLDAEYNYHGMESPTGCPFGSPNTTNTTSSTDDNEGNSDKTHSSSLLQSVSAIKNNGKFKKPYIKLRRLSETFVGTKVVMVASKAMTMVKQELRNHGDGPGGNDDDSS